MKIFLASVMAAALMVAGVAVAAEAPAGPTTIKAKQGNVTFSHSKHTGAIKCDDCHKVFPQKGGEAVAKDKAHAVCVDCHKKGGKGPTKCVDCHKK